MIKSACPWGREGREEFAEEEKSFQLDLIRLCEHPLSTGEWLTPKAKAAEQAASRSGYCVPNPEPGPGHV